MATTAPQRTWEAENHVHYCLIHLRMLFTPFQRRTPIKSFRMHGHGEQTRITFTHVRISALALLKMTIHARSGGNIEIMGLMTGYVSGTSFIITDAFRLPVEGTETRVNAQSEGDEYAVNFGTLSREGGGQQENPIGWYHSHPGYGCWLSGIDVQTEKLQQQVQDPFVAVVIDPDRTVSAGKIEIGAFRTYPDGTQSINNPNKFTHEDDDFQAIPAGKIEDFGAHANAYYSLDVTHFKSTLDTHLLNLLWNKYWTSTLSQSPLYTNRDYATKQIVDHASKIRSASDHIKRSGPNMSQSRSKALVSGADPDKNIKVGKDGEMDKLVRASDRIAGEEDRWTAGRRRGRRSCSGVSLKKPRVSAAREQAVNAAAGQVANGNGT